MIGQALLVLQLATAQLPAPGVADAPFAEEKVAEPVLADQRGGIRLPNGIDVTLSIDTVTALDGRVVLQTVTRIAEGAPVVTAFAPQEGSPVNLPQGAASGANTAAAQPRVSYDRQHGLTVTTGLPSVPLVVTSTGAAKEAKVAEGLAPIDLSRPATTPNGLVQSRGNTGSGGVELQGMDISIVHLTGNALGSAIANSGSDRAIDTQTTLSIDLRNAGPDVLGSAMLRVENVAIGALSTRF